MIAILITKIIYLLSIEADARSDKYTIDTGRIHHGWQVAVLVVIFTPILLWHTSFGQASLTALSYVFLRAGLFNLRLNYLRGVKPYHLAMSGLIGFTNRLRNRTKWQVSGFVLCVLCLYCNWIVFWFI